jgi:hypothetical protein
MCMQVLLNQLPVFRSFWAGLTEEKRQSLVTERSEVVLKVRDIPESADSHDLELSAQFYLKQDVPTSG